MTQKESSPKTEDSPSEVAVGSQKEPIKVTYRDVFELSIFPNLQAICDTLPDTKSKAPKYSGQWIDIKSSLIQDMGQTQDLLRNILIELEK